MRRLIFGVLLLPLFLGLLLAFFSIDHTFGDGEPSDDARWWLAIAGAGALSLVTAFLLVRHSGSQVTFHWLYVLGLACLCFALAEIVHELGREYPSDPYNLFGYQVLSRVVAAVATLVLGLFCLIAAVLQDLLMRGSRTQRPKPAVERTLSPFVR